MDPLQILEHPFHSHEQDVCLDHSIDSALHLLRSARSDPELAVLLYEAGYDRDRWSEGLELWELAQRELSVRERAMSRLERAALDYERAEESARQLYREFRAAARFFFKNAADRIALGVEGRLPEEMEKFLIVARSGYEAAMNSPKYHRRLVQNSCLESAAQSLDVLVAAEAAHEAARIEAFQLAQRYDQISLRLEAWLQCFCKTVRPGLAAHPHFARRIENLR